MALNERVRELAYQAELLVQHKPTHPTKLDKFAELLVIEAASLINDLVTHRIPASEYAGILKQYFGVKDE